MGYIFRRRRKLPDGTEEFYGAFQYKVFDNGRVLRGSTEKYKELEARKFVKILEGTIASDNPVPEMRKTFGALLDDVIQDYRDNSRRSLESTIKRIDKNIRPALGHLKVKDITSNLIRTYRAARLKKVSAGTVNRELNIISKAFSLADLPYRPRIEKLKEAAPRKGFVTEAQLNTIVSHMPEHLGRLVRFLFITAWRRGEVFGLQWRNIGFEDGWIRLDPGSTKNDEGRNFPMISQLRDLLKSQRDYVDRLERKYRRIIPWVFVHADGEKVNDIRKPWKAATTAAKCAGTLLHDLRRSGIMTFSQKGIDQQTGMLLSGHKTASVYRRYNIPTAEVLLAAAEKLESAGTTTGTMEVSANNANAVNSSGEKVSGG